MKTCNCCGKTKDTKDFCNNACRMKYVRHNAQNLISNVRQDAQDDRESVRVDAQDTTQALSDEYIVPEAECLFCYRKVPYDDEREGFYCKKCKLL